MSSEGSKPDENPLAARMGIWTARAVFYGSKILFPVGAILVIARWGGEIGGPWWLVSLPLIVGVALIAVIVVTMTAAILGHKRSATPPPEVLMEVRDNRQDRNLMRAWDADGHELDEAELNKLRGRR